MLRYKGLKGKAARDRAIEALTEVGLKPRMNQRPSQLSGGEKQPMSPSPGRWPRPPAWCSPDEPTSALDGESGQMVVRMLRRAPPPSTARR